MRRSCLSWLLPFLMLLAQQGAYLHELSHYRPATEQDSKRKEQLADKVCETCLAYSHLGAVARPADFAPPLLALAHSRPTAIPWSARPGTAPNARSRGPPALL